MTYEQYIRYHLKGDAGVEERTIAKLCKQLGLSAWDSFRLIYFYTMTYNIPSALRLLLDANVKKADLKFRTDRRYVRCHGAYERLLAELTPDKLTALQACTTTSQAYETVRKWYYFGRYASYLLLEVYVNAFHPSWIDDIKYGWESNENYTRGAVLIVGCTDPGCWIISSRTQKETPKTTHLPLRRRYAPWQSSRREPGGMGITLRGCLMRRTRTQDTDSSFTRVYESKTDIPGRSSGKRKIHVVQATQG